MKDIHIYVNKLIRSINDNDEYVRASSINSLGELKAKIPFEMRRKAVKGIIKAGKDHKNIVRHAAAIATGQLREVIFSEGMMALAVERLMRLSYDREPGIRGAAAISLGELNDNIP